jgi:FAD/FMN-containing dehydrogenase
MSARDEKERDVLWAGRRGAFGAVARLFRNYSVSDGTVPRTELPEVLRQVAQIAKKYELTIGNVFHAGDGNLHPLIFFDARDSQQLDRVHRAGQEILVACAAAGGTISGEHGVGSEKINSMSLVFRPDEIELMRRIKRALDPNDVCNPHKILPERTVISDAEPPKRASQLIAADSEVSGIPCYRPSSADELAEFLGDSCSGKVTLAAIGADTLFSGLPHRQMPDALVSTKALRSIIEHDAENLTVTAEAGLALEELQNELRLKNQFLPLDAPQQATLGGIVAAGLPGLRRHLYGAPRDLVLGLTFIDCFGRTLRAGGKTVKNVAGYDYGKLLIGSWGTLGVITQITFRLLPLPQYQAAFLACFERVDHAREASDKILEAGINPSLLAFSNEAVPAAPIASGNPQHLLLCGAEGAKAAVQKQIAEMKEIVVASSSGLPQTVVGESYHELLTAFTKACYPSAKSDSFLSLCISFRLEESRDVAEAIRHIEEEYGLSAAITSNLAGGSLSVHFTRREDSAQDDAVAAIIKSIRVRLPRESIIVLAHKRNQLKASADSEAVPFITGGGDSARWVKKVSQCFDPANRLNPGLKLW